jgi:branched-chain amino acid transport system ATP-binding protein
MEPVLKLENITRRFSGLVAVDNLSLEMSHDCIHSLIGPNGSGKSTTVNMITGVLPVSEGRIFYNNKLISGEPVFKIARLGIGRTFQNLKLFGSMTVLENLMVGGNQLSKIGLLRFLVDIRGNNHEEKRLKERAEEVAKEVGLLSIRNEKVKNLSYGKQKITELGRALMMKPDLLILDEPAAGLNPSERIEFVDILLQTHSHGIDLFLIEHNMDVVMNISNKITVINFGAKIAEGPPGEIQNNDEVIKAYLGDKYKGGHKNFTH